MPVIRSRFLVHGRVQGVGFRFSTEAEAARLGLAGHARNLPDGTVEVEAEGDEAAVGRLAEFLAEGPRGARVDSVDREAMTPTGGTAFRIRR
ncbi:acylphosphatase [Desertivibrio insolitus]|uniref:acylphosphatase n=1 Tax=Herbiconiux sp. SYSU D00978 TaxID=2812562 RepID=UPI0027DC3231|nr:acylphosphatase [Herbiconiux sp. SYSU D00978]